METRIVQGVRAEDALKNMRRLADLHPVMSVGDAPLVMRVGGMGDQVPDILEWNHADESTSEHVVIDRARFERLLAVAKSAQECVDNAATSDDVVPWGILVAVAGLTHGDGLQPGDLDPLP